MGQLSRPAPHRGLRPNPGDIQEMAIALRNHGLIDYQGDFNRWTATNKLRKILAPKPTETVSTDRELLKELALAQREIAALKAEIEALKVQPVAKETPVPEPAASQTTTVEAIVDMPVDGNAEPILIAGILEAMVEAPIQEVAQKLKRLVCRQDLLPRLKNRNWILVMALRKES